MIIALACDHGGLELKEEIKKHLEQIDIQIHHLYQIFSLFGRLSL